MKFSNSFGFVCVYECGPGDQETVVKECYLLTKGPRPKGWQGKRSAPWAPPEIGKGGPPILMNVHRVRYIYSNRRGH